MPHCDGPVHLSVISWNIQLCAGSFSGVLAEQHGCSYLCRNNLNNYLFLDSRNRKFEEIPHIGTDLNI